MKRPSFALIFLLFLGCTNGVSVDKVYQNRNLLMSLCKDQTLLKSRGNNFLIFKTYKGENVNEYYINLDSGKLTFIRDSIQYNPDIVGWNSFNDSTDYKREVCKYVSEINQKLKGLKINSFRTDFSKLGVPFEFYMIDGKTVVCIPDLGQISEHNIDYKKSLKKIKGNWYYTQ